MNLKECMKNWRQLRNKIHQLSSALEKRVKVDRHTQVHIQSSEQVSMTELKSEDVELLLQKWEEFQKLNSKFEEKIHTMDNEVNRLKHIRKVTSTHYSNPESTRQMSPKYMNAMNIDNSKFLDEVVEVDKGIIEHIQNDIDNHDSFEGNCCSLSF